MRGKRFALGAPVSPDRNIPAYAGKTFAETPEMTKPEEHPRVCGENSGYVAYRLICWCGVGVALIIIAAVVTVFGGFAFAV